MSSLIELRNERLKKVSALRELGIDPYPSKSHRDQFTATITSAFADHEGKKYTLAGRLVSWREHGGVIFADLRDGSGDLQLYIKQENLSHTSSEAQTIGFSDLNLFDVGDLVETTGTVTKTKRGEMSLEITSLKMLAKSIRPLPDKHDGLKDPELLSRKRYLDLIVNPEKRWRFQKGAELTFAIREFMNSKGFLEIKTPILQSLYGGGTAKPFTTRLNILDIDVYLAISHELYLKRLITAGFENVYNIAGYFRNEGIDRTHNPEFTMLETMSAFKNYEDNMDLTEELYRHITKKVFGRTTFTIKGQQVDFAKTWRRVRMVDIVREVTGSDFGVINNLPEAQKIITKLGYNKEMPETVGECLVAAFEVAVEQTLIEPTFVMNHPIEISPLAKRSSDPRYAERFEIFIGGIEGGDNWTELNDPVELLARFKDQAQKREAGNEEAHPFDIDFIEMMEHGMPPTTGLGPGIERLIMMLTEGERIDDVIFFPLLRPAPLTPDQRELYLSDSVSGELVVEQDFSKKLVIALRDDIENWQALNTVSHISARLGHDIDKLTTGEMFETADKKAHPRNSQYPIIAVKADAGDLKKLISKVRASGLPFIGYIREMIETTDDKEIVTILSSKKDDDIEYLGIGVFGPNEEVDALMKKFRVWK